jgi:5-methylcytosine-specific restriction endonuclease McrA
MSPPREYRRLIEDIQQYWGDRTLCERCGLSKTDLWMLKSGGLHEPRTSGQRSAMYRAWRELYQ